MATNTQTLDRTTAVNSGGNSLVPASGNMLATIRNVTQQPSFQRAFPTLIAVLAIAICLIVFAIMQKPERTTLYASLPEAEKSRIVDALTNAGVDVTLDPTTGEVMVPAADYHSSRIQLAALGLPQSVPDGYDTLGNIPMGTSRSVETMRLKQAQEVELARSITEISAVRSARVHLALPEKSVFVREQMPPTASVFLQLDRGRAMDENQVAAIINLVAASVPSLAKDNVTVVDQSGRLLSKAPDDPSSILTDNQLQYRMRLENIYRSRIESLVTPIVGPGNATARVNIDFDFTRREVTEESVDPEGNALRSEQSTLDVTSKSAAIGIPGALSNTAPTEAELITDGSQAAGMSDKNGVQSESSSQVRNYEVSRKVQTTQQPTNTIVRINAALLVRDQKVKDPETGEMVVRPVDASVLADIENLVASAIGLQADRGDVLTVKSQPFIEELEGIEVDWYEAEWVEGLAKQVGMILMLAVVSLGVIRPLLNRLLVPAGGEMVARGGLSDEDAAALESVEVNAGETLEDIKAKLKPKKANISMEMLDTANTYDDKVAIIRMIVSDEAGRVSNVFKQMMKKEMDVLG
ncbi:flagellar basal-body MS-ring/collar protein FliF [uncultured Lentibacter sp.]|uniref:flagellar basal-body MS-ring/collar protein FliF n=1 Tax=uncultured Lentibacter sp. TaxID=1659309 RepID=UPI00260AA26A|nr:flagellar basal-body MS-ring/collar protein FliF [uncultured Lentibacter sp.]